MALNIVDIDYCSQKRTLAKGKNIFNFTKDSIQSFDR